MPPHPRRTLAMFILGVTSLAIIASSLAVRRFPETAIGMNRAGYRRYLATHGAIILATDSARLQRTLNDCGVAVIREALRTLGVPEVPPHDSIARLANLTAVGTTLSNLARVVALFGVHATFSGTRVLGSHLLVAHLSIGHFVLVRGVSNNGVRFFDPMVGEVVASASVFQSLWSGHGFAVTMGEVAPANASPRRSAPPRRGNDFSLPSMEKSR